MRRAALLLACLLAYPRTGACAEGFPYELRLEAETYRYRLYQVRFPTARPSPFEANNTVWGHLYVPRRSSAPPPAVLVLPVMAAPNIWIETRFLREFLRLGLAVLWLEMPYQFHRRPHPSMPSGQVFLARTAKRLGENFRQSRDDALRALGWLSRSGMVSGERLGLFGVSLGAMVAASAYSLDGRPRGGLFLLGGADFPDLVFRGEMTARFALRAGIAREELSRAWRGLDPLDHRGSNAGKKALLINARSDTVIPPENARKLHEAFPGSRLMWVPGGHYTALLHMAWVPSYAAWKLSRMLR